jgi:hypothetical protein
MEKQLGFLNGGLVESCVDKCDTFEDNNFSIHECDGDKKNLHVQWHIRQRHDSATDECADVDEYDTDVTCGDSPSTL